MCGETLLRWLHIHLGAVTDEVDSVGARVRAYGLRGGRGGVHRGRRPRNSRVTRRSQCGHRQGRWHRPRQRCDPGDPSGRARQAGDDHGEKGQGPESPSRRKTRVRRVRVWPQGHDLPEGREAQHRNHEAGTAGQGLLHEEGLGDRVREAREHEPRQEGRSADQALQPRLCGPARGRRAWTRWLGCASRCRHRTFRCQRQ